MVPAFSAHKRFLFAAALMAVFGLSACVVLSAMLLRIDGVDPWAETLALALFLLALLLCLLVGALFDEYTRCARPDQGPVQRLARLRRTDLRAMTDPCPQIIRWALVGIGLLALFQVLRFGHFEVQLTDTGTAGFRIVGILAGATFFYSLSAPFLLAAALMPGSYGAAAPASPRD